MQHNEIDYAARQFLYKRFFPRPDFDRQGRPFNSEDIPPDDNGRPSTEVARKAQSLSVDRLVSKGSNPCDDFYEVKTDLGERCVVRMQWLRLYWQEADGTR